MEPYEKLHRDGTFLMMEEKLSEAVVKFRAVLETHPDYHAARSNMGMCLCGLEQFEEGMKCFDHILEKDPKFSMAYSQKILVLASMEKFEEAAILYEKLYKLDPECGFCLEREARNALYEDREEDAKKLFKKLVAKVPEMREGAKMIMQRYADQKIREGKCRFCRKVKSVRIYQMQYGPCKYCDKCADILRMTGTL